MAMQAYWAEDKAYPEEGGGTIIASSEEDAMTAALRVLAVERDGVNLYTAETAEGAIKEKLEELNDAMEKSAREAARLARAEGAAAEREACAVRIKQAADQLDAAAARIGELVAERDMAKAMIDDLNDDLALAMQQRNAARAEGAAAEREACAQLALGQADASIRCDTDFHQQAASQIARAIRARSKDATR